MARNACKTCGMVTRDPGEFHPHVFCMWVKAGRNDPWGDLLDVNRMLGVDVTHWPKQPPLIKNITTRAFKP